MDRIRIVMPTFEEIKRMPPTITLINTLVDLGFDVTYITIYPDEYYENFDKEHVLNIALCSKKIKLLRYMKNRLFRSIAYRIDLIVEKIISHFIGRLLNKELKEDDILWVVNELTVMYAGSHFLKKYKNKFIFTMYELHPSGFFARNIEKTANYSAINVVPEYNRAHMQKLFFKLKKLPVVLPNKPGNHPMQKNIDIEIDDIKKKLCNIKKSGKKIILYMGIIGEERPLESFIEAIDEVKENYEFVIMGTNSEYLKKLQSLYPGKFTYLGFFKPPMHLTIASHADIGLLVYVGENSKFGLNAMYCAPNKIYEYTGFGMPVITNDIPGLYYTIETNRCGYCVDLNNKQEIVECLKKINDNYEELSENAIKFYNNLDIEEVINNIVTMYREEIQ